MTAFRWVRRAAACLLYLSLAHGSRAADWPAWRGPLGNGVSAENGLPLKWSARENVKWRYTMTQGGDCFVFKASPKFELLAVNSLGERSNSSIVPSNGELFIRTHAALWCISSRESREARCGRR